MTQPTLFDRPEPDICQNRHKGNVHSVAAHERLGSHAVNMRERVRVFVGGCGFSGATLKEICAAFGKLPNELSGRLSELKRDHLVFDSGRSREGCAVLVGRKEWVNQCQ